MKKKKPQPPTFIHDNFDGSNSCIECNGPCKLTGAERFVTDLVRAVYETAAYVGIEPHYPVVKYLKDHGVDVDRLRMASLEVLRNREPRLKKEPRHA